MQFSKKIRQYLIYKFDTNPMQVAADMRTITDNDGNRYFIQEEWLTPRQIKGFFSRQAKLPRTTVAHRCSTHIQNQIQPCKFQYTHTNSYTHIQIQIHTYRK